MSAPDGLSFYPDFLTQEEQGALLLEVTSYEYKHDFFRGKRMRRGYAQFGYSYVTSSRQVTPVEPYSFVANSYLVQIFNR